MYLSKNVFFNIENNFFQLNEKYLDTYCIMTHISWYISIQKTMYLPSPTLDIYCSFDVYYDFVGCRSDEFTCFSDKTCIPLTSRCNRQRDCQDGSDEFDCRKNIFFFAVICFFKNLNAINCQFESLVIRYVF